MSFETLTLVPANKEQTRETRRQTYAEWAKGLTLDEYLARETILDAAEHAAAKLTTWVLVPRNDTATSNFLCLCETYRRRSLVKRPASAEPEEVVAYGISSVFTPIQYRGRRYGSFMMRLLHWVLAPSSTLPPFPAKWGMPPVVYGLAGDASFTVLYSDIGANFYKMTGPDESSEGWIVRAPYSTIINVPSAIPSRSGPYNVRYLTERDCKAVWTQDAEQMKTDLCDSHSPKTTFAFLPDGGVSASHLSRLAFYLPSLPFEMPSYCGVALQTNAAEAVPTFATWSFDTCPSPLTLIVTRLRATKKTFPHLMECLFSATKESGMERVEIWNLPKELELLTVDMGGVTTQREEHLNAFKWYGSEKNEDLEWAYNEKFCWC